MSLHRVASIESWERPSDGTRSLSPSRQPRKMSFNPVGDWVVPTAAEPATVGKPVVPVEEQISSLESSSPAKRILQVAIASTYCLLSSGLVFGFAALKPVLVSEGVYSSACPASSPPADKGSDVSPKPCYDQELRLNLMFAIAAVATNVCALPVGTILDRYGPRASTLVGSVLLTIGSAFFIAAPHFPANVDPYIPGYLFLALAGPFIYISAFQLSNCFPRNSGLILALLTGAFDTSSAVFLGYRLVYTASDGLFKPSDFFMLYLAVPVFIVIVQIAVMPRDSYKTVGEMVVDAEPDLPDSIAANDFAFDAEPRDSAQRQQLQQELQQRRDDVLTEFDPLLGTSASERDREAAKLQHRSGVWGALHGQSALQQIQTPWFVLITLLVVVQMTRINYFVATVRSQYTRLLGSYDAAVAINNFFDVALPVGGVISIPFVGLLLDNLSTAATLAILVVTATTIGVLGTLPFAWAAYANVLLFVLYRPLYYTAVSDYAAKVFGFHTFGKVYGLIICLAGLGNFSQSALDALTHRTFADDPVPVNVMLLSLVAVIGTTLVLYVWRQSRSLEHLEREELEEEAEESEQRETLLPAATDRPGTDAPAGYGATNGSA